MMKNEAEGAYIEQQGATVNVNELRKAISREYEEVAENPTKGFHFHTGRQLVSIVGYKPDWLKGIPEAAIESFAGTGCPFSLGEIKSGEHVVDIGCGAGIDTLIAGKMVGSRGHVIGVDMTDKMLARARKANEEAGFTQVEFKKGYMEDLPVQDEWADVIISNGVLNLAPDKKKVLQEFARVLKPSGRLQIADIPVQRKVPESAKRKIDLWTG